MEEANLIEIEMKTPTSSYNRDDGWVSEGNSMMGLEDRVQHIKTGHRGLEM